MFLWDQIEAGLQLKPHHCLYVERKQQESRELCWPDFCHHNKMPEIINLQTEKVYFGTCFGGNKLGGATVLGLWWAGWITRVQRV